MKIAPALLAQSKRFARDEDVTLCALLEEGLRKVLAEREKRPHFSLRKVPFTGGEFNMFKKMVQSLAFVVILCASATTLAEDAYCPGVKVDRILQTSVDSTGHRIEYPQSGTQEVTGVVVNIPAGASTGWHVHTVPCVAYVAQGAVTIQREDGSAKTVVAGQTFAEVVNLNHKGTNTGSVPAKIILFAIGTQGTPVAVKR